MLRVIALADVGLGVLLLAFVGWAFWKMRQITREWRLLTQSRSGLVRSWADANMLWKAEVAYGGQLAHLFRMVRLAAGRQALEDPRVQAAIKAADNALDVVLAQSERHTDTPAGDDVHQPALLGRLASRS